MIYMYYNNCVCDHIFIYICMGTFGVVCILLLYVECICASVCVFVCVCVCVHVHM